MTSQKTAAKETRDMSDYCMLFSQTFYGLLFSYLTITDVTSYVHHKFPVSLVLYIATKKLNQIMAVNSSANAPITQKNNSCMQSVPMFFGR